MYSVLNPGILNLRFDVSGVAYDHETRTVPLSPTIGSRILVDVTTTNSIITLGWGPEVAVPSGRIRPYINGEYSRLFFRTTSSVDGIDSSGDSIASTTNYKDGTGAWVVGGGLRVPLGRRDSPVTLDVGLRYYRGGTASYLKEGSIVDNPDGSITITPLRSRTPLVVYAIGIQFRIPHGPGSCARLLC